MEIVAALFVEHIDLRPVAGPSTRIDLSGVFFSLPAPAAPTPERPVRIEPHLVVLIRCRPDEPGQGVLEVVFRPLDAPADAEPMARNVSPFTVEPGKFTYRLVRSELEFAAPGTVEAHCRLAGGPTLTVPLTLLPPVD